MEPATNSSLLLFCEQRRQHLLAIASFFIVVICLVNLIELDYSRDFFRADGVKDMELKGIVERLSTTNIRCSWSPSAEEECLSLLSTRLLPQRRLWLFFGDSTMSRLYQHSPPLQNILVTNPLQQCPGCTFQTTERCQNNKAYGLSIKGNWSWEPPGPLEGPVDYGKSTPNCLDCSGCVSHFLSCQNAPCQGHLGSYFSVEFAKDVELQSEEYNTTQENIVLFLEHWMTATFNATSSSTTCILNFGIHDMTIPTMDDVSFVNNVKWFFELLDPRCGRFVWIHSTAPQTENFRQLTPILKVWNEAVFQMLSSTPHLQNKTSVVDLFEASKNYTHDDNVHMGANWYFRLGEMFSKLV